MKLFAVRNDNSKGLAVERGRDYKTGIPGFGGHHSGGLVVLADSLEEAQEMFIESLKPLPNDTSYKTYMKAVAKGKKWRNVADFEHIAEMLEEISPSIRAGVVLFADGEC